MSGPEIVIVGGGVAGGAIAAVLARSGTEVLVLERQVEYRDKVRGEVMYPWGVAELRRMGLEDELLRAGGGYATRLVMYDESIAPEQAEALPIPLDGVVAGIPGSLNVGHPQGCEAFTRAAEAAGATVRRDVRNVAFRGGRSPEVTYTVDGATHEVRTRLVIGADGRSSAMRRQAGFGFHETAPRTVLGGWLVKGVDGLPQDRNIMATAGDLFLLAFPRPGGISRIYLEWDISQRGRFSGPGREDEFRAAVRSFGSCPAGSLLGAGLGAGPVASYPMNDSSTDTPITEGMVLIGDAAGWSDPTIGQGVSVAMRDARSVSEVLLSSDDWTPLALRPYADERRERMRRLQLALEITLLVFCDFTARGRARRAAWRDTVFADQRLFVPASMQFMGPETADPELVTNDAVELVRGLGG